MMPTEHLIDLSEEVVSNILNRVSDLDCQTKMLVLLDEVRSCFKRFLNEMEFQFEILHNPLIPNRNEFLELFD
jgi:hypothetical protein